MRQVETDLDAESDAGSDDRVNTNVTAAQFPCSIRPDGKGHFELHNHLTSHLTSPCSPRYRLHLNCSVSAIPIDFPLLLSSPFSHSKLFLYLSFQPSLPCPMANSAPNTSIPRSSMPADRIQALAQWGPSLLPAACSASTGRDAPRAPTPRAVAARTKPLEEITCTATGGPWVVARHDITNHLVADPSLPSNTALPTPESPSTAPRIAPTA